MAYVDTYVARVRCPECQDMFSIEMPRQAYKAWMGGAYVQDAWPEATASVREQLISGVCGVCWESLFGGEEW